LCYLVLVFTVPLAYFVDILPTNVPFSVIVANQGPTYYKARQVILSYQGTSKHASIQTIQSLYEKHSGTTGVVASDAAMCIQGKLTTTTENADKPFDVFDSCHIAALHSGKPVAKEATITKAPVATIPLSLTVHTGDSQTTLVRSLIEANSQSAKLAVPQKAFLENRLVATIGNDNLIYAGQVFNITQRQFSMLVSQSQQLTAAQLQAWAQY
jgi:hypothetical protein